MAKDKKHVYSIDLDIKSTTASKQALKELQTAYEAGNKDMNTLNASYAEKAVAAFAYIFVATVTPDKWLMAIRSEKL